MATTPPSSQKADVRPITFVLVDRASGAPSRVLRLYLRPEDLTRSDPSRVMVHQTLGGAWVDSFGAGLPQITLSGHTGWRRDADGADGLDRFAQLFATVFDGWHRAREAAVQAAKDPALVQLLLVDALDGFVANVVPQSYVLRRSKSRPLLASYQIQLLAVDSERTRAPEVAAGLPTGAARTALGLESLAGSIGRLTGFMTGLRGALDKALLGPATAFLRQTVGLMTAVRGLVTSVRGVAVSVINIARTVAQAGLNVFRSIASLVTLPLAVRAMVKQVAAEFGNILCVLRNALRAPTVLEDYTPLYGASTCSSTRGGRAPSSLSSTNAFTTVRPTPAPPPVALTTQSRDALQTLASADPVRAPLTSATAAALLQTATDGMVLA